MATVIVKELPKSGTLDIVNLYIKDAVVVTIKSVCRFCRKLLNESQA